MVEIDFAHLDPSSLRPDEDYLAQDILPLHLKVDADIRDAVHRAVRRRTDDVREEWSLSLDNLGTVAHQGTVPPEAITRVALFDSKMVPELSIAMLDTKITIPEHRTRSQQIEAWTRWLFDGPAAVRVTDFEPELQHLGRSNDSLLPETISDYALKYEKNLRLILDRWNVEVRVNANYRGRLSETESAP